MTQIFRWVVILLGIIVVELIVWGAILGDSSLILLGIINCLFLVYFFAADISRWLRIDQGAYRRFKTTLRHFLDAYGNTLLVMLLLWFLTVRLLTGIGLGEVITFTIALTMSGYATNWRMLRVGLQWSDQPVPLRVCILLLSLACIVVLLSLYWNHAISFVYTLAFIVGFVVYTIGLEILRQYTGNIWRKMPFRWIYAGVVILVIIRSLGFTALQRIDDHTIEKVIYQDKPVYILGEEGEE